jgi:hypothetical protein
MPEISDADYRSFVRYQMAGTPDEVEKKIRDLERDNVKQRDEIRVLKEATPKEGTVIVPKEKAEALTEYEKLGTPVELKARVEKVSTLEEEVAKRDRESSRDAAAKALGIEGKDLASFAGADALKFATREVEADGKKVTVAFVTDAEGKEHPLAEYGKKQWGRPFEAVVQPGGTKPPANGTPYHRETNTPPPTRTGKASGEDYLKATDATANYVI